MDDNLEPIFIFSLPRSGSTLLQKLLMTHPEINSVAEPWLLLPFIHANKKKGVITNYNQKLCYNAIQDFISNIGGQDVYNNILKNFIIQLYGSVSGNRYQYFLDKTPRYYMIISEIAQIFPDAKFIFLFRNPISIYSSILRTWHDNEYLTLYKHYVDLFEGPKYLTEGYQELKDRSIKINYDDLVIDKQNELLKIATYLELEIEKFDLSGFSEQNLKGRMGDQVGIKKYSNVSKSSLQKWKKTFNTVYRKKKIKDYINYLDDEYLELTNINKEEIISDINSIQIEGLGIKDFLGLSISNIYRRIKLKFQIQNGRELLWQNDEKSIYF